MNNGYLPGDLRDRILDLMSGRSITQEQLANATGDERTRLGRFLSKKTDSMNYTQIIAIADFFGVTTDFLLGRTNEYNNGSGLRLGKADAAIVQKLLDNKNFVIATRHIRQYLDETLSSGIAMQNQIFASVVTNDDTAHFGRTARNIGKYGIHDILLINAPNHARL